MTEENIRLTENDLPQEFILKLLGQYEARGLWGIKHTREPVDLMVRYAKTHELSLPIVQVVVTREGIFMSPIQCRLDNRSGENVSIRKIETRCRSFSRTPFHEAWNGDPVIKSKTFFNKTKEKDKFNAKEKKTDLQLLEKYSKFDWRKRGIFFFGIDTISYGVQDLIFTRVFSMIVLADGNQKSVRGSSPFMCHAFVCESRNTARKLTYALAAAFQAYGKSMKFIREDDNLPKKNSKRSPEDRPRKVTLELRPPHEAAFNDSEA